MFQIDYLIALNPNPVVLVEKIEGGLTINPNIHFLVSDLALLLSHHSLVFEYLLDLLLI